MIARLSTTSAKEYITRMEELDMPFPKSSGPSLFPLLVTVHAGEGAGDTTTTTDITPISAADSIPSIYGDATSTHDIKKTLGKGSNTLSAQQGQQDPWRRGRQHRRAVRCPGQQLVLVSSSHGRAICEFAGMPISEGYAFFLEAQKEAWCGGSEEAGSFGEKIEVSATVLRQW